MKIIRFPLLAISKVLAAACLVLHGSANELSWLDSYNVKWTNQSKNSSESMPCGGRDTGMNVWVENGDILCYVQRSGSFDENNQYLKLGRIRLQLSPNPLGNGSSFSQNRCAKS